MRVAPHRPPRSRPTPSRPLRRRLCLPAALLSAVLCGVAPPVPALERIDFTTQGLDADLQQSLRAASLLLTSQRDGQTDAQALFLAARADYARLLGALYAAGHYSAAITIEIDGREAAGIAPLDAPEQIGVIRVAVSPGPTFRFDEARVAPLAPGTQLPAGFAPGAPAPSGTIRAAATAGVEGWRAQGHAKAAVAAQDIVADHTSATLAARIALDPGPRLRFGPLNVRGAERMRLRRIEKIAGLPSGEVFSPAELDRAAERLRRTGVFRSVTLTEAERILAPDLLPIIATVVEEKPRRFSIGGEIASFDGVSLTGYWLHRNLLGGAERLRVDAGITNLGAQTSGVDYSLGVSIDRPATLTPDTSLGFAATAERLDEEDYTANVFSIGTRLTHVFSPSLTGRLGLSYDLSQGRDAVDDFRFRNLALPLGLSWDRRDSKVDATEGLYLDGEIKPFLGLGTTDSGVRISFDGRVYRGFGEGHRVVLAGRLLGGAIYGSGLLGTPRDDLFYSGGGGSVRGQPYQSLGVLLTRGLTDSKIGGTQYLGTQMEARLRVSEKIGVVGFVDAGRIDVGGFFGDAGDWHAGAGLGLRYDTGFGPIRVDVATPVGGTTGDGWQVYVGLGQAF
ncbi:MAG: hypothetical protein RIT14_2719 [Pseudomonadota bacterium]